MDVIAAYQQVGTYRGAAVMCGTTHKTVKRIIERAGAGGKSPDRAGRGHNYDLVAELAADRVAVTKGGSRRSGCCPRRGPWGMRGRRGISGGWSRRRRGRGAGITTGAGAGGVDAG